jgi:hypothetical protein
VNKKANVYGLRLITFVQSDKASSRLKTPLSFPRAQYHCHYRILLAGIYGFVDPRQAHSGMTSGGSFEDDNFVADSGMTYQKPVNGEKKTTVYSL